MKSLADCQDVTMRTTKELMKYDCFCGGLGKGCIGMMDWCGTLYMKDVTEMLQRQVEFLGKKMLLSVHVWETHCQELHPEV